jgi:type I restriction enzyme S subunit
MSTRPYPTREAPAGEATLFDGKAQICLGQRMMYFRADPQELDPSFLLFDIYSNAAKGYIYCESRGSTVTHLRLGQVYNFPIPQPPIAEQRIISRYLAQETAKIDALMAKVRTAIERLQEYRTVLISAAVTSQIEVRHCVGA